VYSAVDIWILWATTQRPVSSVEWTFTPPPPPPPPHRVVTGETKLFSWHVNWCVFVRVSCLRFLLYRTMHTQSDSKQKHIYLLPVSSSTVVASRTTTKVQWYTHKPVQTQKIPNRQCAWLIINYVVCIPSASRKSIRWNVTQQHWHSHVLDCLFITLVVGALVVRRTSLVFKNKQMRTVSSANALLAFLLNALTNRSTWLGSTKRKNGGRVVAVEFAGYFS